MEMHLLASIDVGSNTFRLLIGKINQDNMLIEIFSDRIITRLGYRVGETGRLQQKNMVDSLSALRKFASILDEYHVEKISAVATSALREASNADSFIQRVFAETGIRIDVIAGEREAELTLKGLLASFPHSEFGHPESAFIVDIGGGSTECIVYRDTHVVFMQSIPVGVIKLAAQFLKSDPPSQKDIRDMDTEILSVLNKLHAKIRDAVDQQTQFIGTAGTFSTLAAIDLSLIFYSREKLHMHSIPLGRLQAISKRLISLPLKERKKVPGLEPERADLIIPGLHFTINTMRLFHFSSLIVSEYGILEGVLLETYEKNISAT